MNSNEVVSSCWVDHCPPEEDFDLLCFGGLEAVKDAVGGSDAVVLDKTAVVVFFSYALEGYICNLNIFFDLNVGLPDFLLESKVRLYY